MVLTVILFGRRKSNRHAVAMAQCNRNLRADVCISLRKACMPLISSVSPRVKRAGACRAT